MRSEHDLSAASDPFIRNKGSSPPPIVVRIYRAAGRYYASPRHQNPPTRAQLQSLMMYDEFNAAGSKSTIDRARHDHPEYFPAWPIEAEPHPDLHPMLADELIAGQLPPVGTQLEIITSDGQLLKGHIRKIGPLAAAFMGWLIIDALDGKLDGMVHWCQLLMTHARAVL